MQFDFLWKLLHPVFAHPLFIKIAVPVCAANEVARYFTKHADPGTWQGKLYAATDVVRGICAAAGIGTSMAGVTAAQKMQGDTPTATFFDPNSGKS